MILRDWLRKYIQFMNLTVILVLISAVAVAAVVALLVVIQRNAAERQRIAKEYEDAEDDLRRQLMELTGEKAALESTLKARDEYESRLREEQEKALEAQRQAQEKAMAAQREIQEKAMAEQKEAQERALNMQKEQHAKELENMKDAFKALSADNSSEFKRQSAESISDLLKPIQEKFAEFGKAVQESRKEAVEQSAQLKEHIHNVMERSQALGRGQKPGERAYGIFKGPRRLRRNAVDRRAEERRAGGRRALLHPERDDGRGWA